MPWTRFSVATIGNEERPIDSATMIDVVRTDQQNLIDESPAMGSWPIINTLYTTTSATYTDASTFVRLPPMWLRSSDAPHVVRRLRFSVYARLSVGTQTGTLRAWAGQRWDIPADVAAADFVTAESSGISSTTLVNRVWTLSVQRVHTYSSSIGFDDGEAVLPMRWVIAGLQGKVTGGATLTVERISVEEINP